MSFGFVLTSLEQGLIYAFLAMGVYITYKILDIADLTVEGAFAFGAFVFASAMYSGLNSVTATVLALLLGVIPGLITSFLFTGMKIKPLLAGILTMTMFYSVNLRIMGKANVSLFKFKNIYQDLSILGRFTQDKAILQYDKILVLLILIAIVKIALDLFFKTEMGYLLIATGDNERLVHGIGENSNKYKIIGMMMSSALASMSGALFAQNLGFVDISLSNSVIVTALASVIIGDGILRKMNFLNPSMRAIIGAVLYMEISGMAIALKLEPTDLKALSALIVIAFLTYNNVSQDLMTKKKLSGNPNLKRGQI